MELGNDTFVSPGVINFEKMQLIAQVFMKLSALQCMGYALQKVYHITDWLQNLHTLSDADVRKHSLLIEVRLQLSQQTPPRVTLLTRRCT